MLTFGVKEADLAKVEVTLSNLNAMAALGGETAHVHQRFYGTLFQQVAHQPCIPLVDIMQVA